MSWLLTFLLLLAISIFGIKYWMEHKTYVFDQRDIVKIALMHVEKGNIEDSFARIAEELEARYPGHILPASDREWIFMNAGGWMGAIYLLHASPTEYVHFFGTAVDTQGHSGRHWANISDTILTGSFRQWKEGSLKSQVYGPGDTLVHFSGEVTAVQWTAGTWMVEYGRGFIPSTLGFALVDTLFSTQDFYVVYKLLKVYSKALFKETLLYCGDILEWFHK